MSPALTVEQTLAKYVASTTPPSFEKMTMPDAERDELIALYKRDPKQVLVVRAPDVDPGDYIALSRFPGKVLIIDVPTFAYMNAHVLADWHGDTLFVQSATLTKDVATGLAEWGGKSLHLDQLDHLDADEAQALSQWKGQTLGLGRAKIDPDATAKLAAFKGLVAIKLATTTVAATGMPPGAESDGDLATLGRISKAVDTGDVAAIEDFLAKGGQVDMNERGTTLLMEATNLKQLEIVKVLVAAHANVNAISSAGTTPLYYALSDQVRTPRDNPQTVSELVHLLVEAGAEVSTTGKGDLWQSPLSQAAKRGDKTLIAYLMTRGPKGQPIDQRAFIDAINAGNADAIKQLLAAGANVNPPSPAMGMSPIHQAVTQGAMAISMARYEKKDASVLVKQWSDIVDVVITAGANIEAQDERGETPLEDAINGGVVEILMRVLAAKPKLDAVDGKGRTPLQYLADNHRLEEKDLVPLATLMRARGAPADAKAATIAESRKFAALAKALALGRAASKTGN